MRSIAVASAVVIVAMAALPAFTVATPEPTRRPQAERTPRPDGRPPAGSPAPGQSVGPSEGPSAGPTPVAAPPARTTLTVGYGDPGLLGYAPLLLAREAGYFAAAGFDEVRIVEVADTLADVRDDQLDIAVVDAREAAGVAATEDSTLRAIAGFRNYGADGTYGGDLLLSGPGLVADEPSTVVAFLTAYIRALQDLADPASAEEALAIIEATDLSVEPEVADDWTAQVAIHDPFDGGFGSLEEEGGLGELEQWLADGGVELPDPSYFIASHTLNIAQALAGLDPNPASAFAGAPGITELRFGLPPTVAGSLPLTAAVEGGYFTEAGFTDVRLLEVEEPLLGLLNGELDLGVLDAETAAEAVSQGVPVVALAGHVNASGARDVIAASADLVTQEGSTVAAFLIAYLRGLQDVADDPSATAHAPWDGGFGDRGSDGGLAELRTDLTEALGTEPDLNALIAEEPLEYAQAWWGLPANPIRVPALDTAPIESPQSSEEAA